MSTLTVGTISEKVTDAGVAVDGFLAHEVQSVVPEARITALENA